MPEAVYEDPRLVCSARHTETGITITFNDAEYAIPHERVWHVFDCLRSHIESYGAVDIYGREIATEDI